MIRVMRFYVRFWVVTLLLVGCTGKNVITDVPDTRIQLPEPNHITFRGKGAGAGMALMSTMGPVGIAIGVAIDEGIAKEIRAAADNANFDLHNVLLQVFKRPLAYVSEQPDIQIKRYGFEVVSGTEDQVRVFIEVVIYSDEKTIELNYPRDFAVENTKTFADLQAIKTDGPLVNRLLEFEFQRLFMALQPIIKG